MYNDACYEMATAKYRGGQHGLKSDGFVLEAFKRDTLVYSRLLLDVLLRRVSTFCLCFYSPRAVPRVRLVSMLVVLVSVGDEAKVAFESRKLFTFMFMSICFILFTIYTFKCVFGAVTFAAVLRHKTQQI